MSGFYQRLVRPCPNCDGRVCMDCVTRTVHDNCGDSPCPDCVAGWVDLDATDHPLAAWAIPGDTVLVLGDHEYTGQIRKVWQVGDGRCTTVVENTDTYTGEGNLDHPLRVSLSDLARVVTPADEARRAKFSPQFAYPLETP